MIAAWLCSAFLCRRSSSLLVGVDEPAKPPQGFGLAGRSWCKRSFRSEHNADMLILKLCPLKYLRSGNMYGLASVGFKGFQRVLLSELRDVLGFRVREIACGTLRCLCVVPPQCQTGASSRSRFVRAPLHLQLLQTMSDFWCTMCFCVSSSPADVDTDHRLRSWPVRACAGRR